MFFSLIFNWRIIVLQCGVVFCHVNELAAQSCPALCNPMECNPVGSSVHGILQERILEWIAISFSRGSSQPRDWTQVSWIAGRCFTAWAAREAHTTRWISCKYTYVPSPIEPPSQPLPIPSLHWVFLECLLHIRHWHTSCPKWAYILRERYWMSGK